MIFRIASRGDETALAEIFARIDTTFFRPHDFTPTAAADIANRAGRDLYALLFDGDEPVAYGMLRGWDEGYATPSLGIAVRQGRYGRGIGRRMMRALQRAAMERGAPAIRLRVHRDNLRARRLYEGQGYAYAGEERGELVMNLPLPSIAATGVRLLRPEDKAWDATLAPGGPSVFHSAAYHRYVAGFGDGAPYLAVVGDETNGVAWPYLLRDLAEVPGLSGTDQTDITSAYGYPGPLVWGWQPSDPLVAPALDRIAQVWRLQGAVSVFTRFNPLLRNDLLLPATPRWAARSSPGVLACGMTVSVDLTRDIDAIRAGYQRDLARQIRRSRAAGLETIVDTQWGYLPTFAEHYRQTMERVGATDFYFFSLADFERLRDCLGDAVHLLVTRLGDVVASAGLFFDSGEDFDWHLVSTNGDLIGLSPSKVLIDDAIAWAKGRGFRTLHLGGGRGGREDSLSAFKGRFSPRRHPFAVGEWILDARAYDRLVGRRAGTSDGSSPPQRYFPAYRDPALTEADVASRSRAGAAPG